MNNSIFNQKPGEVSSINGNENLTRDRVDSVQGNNINNNRFINSRASDISSQNNPNISGNLQAEDSAPPIEPAVSQPNVSAPPIEPAVSQPNVSAPPIEPAVSQPNVSAPPIEPAASQPNVTPIVNKNENLSENTNVSASSPFVETTPSGNPIIGGVPLNNSNISNNSSRKYYTADNEQYLKAYIGKNFEKIASGKFSFPAFFFTSFYLYYRKMYLLGIGYQFILPIIISILVLFLLPIIIAFDSPIISAIIIIIIFLTVNISLGLKFNRIYLKHALLKVENLKLKYQEPKALLTACTVKGGTSIFKAILITLLPLIIMIILIVICITTFGIKMSFNLSNMFDNSKSHFGTSESYNGIMAYGSEENVTNNFNVTVPSAFEKGTIKYTYDTGGTEVFNDCDFSFNVVNGYNDAEKLAKEMSNYYLGTKEVSTNKINGIDWHSFNESNDINKSYYNITEKDNKVYIADYSIGTGVTNSTVCENYYNEIMQSISYK